MATYLLRSAASERFEYAWTLARRRSRDGPAFRATYIPAWYGCFEAGTFGSLSSIAAASRTTGASIGPVNKTTVAQPDLTRKPITARCRRSVCNIAGGRIKVKLPHVKEKR